MLTRFLFLFFVVGIPQSAYAITAGDVVDRMTFDERFAWMSASVETMGFLYAKNGEKQKSVCIIDWYFKQDGATEELIAVFENHKDLPAVGIIDIVAKRHCG